jgi:lantibiotic modifying enzyme
VLYRPEAVEPLTESPWDEARVRDAIAAIAADAGRAYEPGRLWPAHEEDAEGTEPPLKELYSGAAGVVWSLGRLQRTGHADAAIDLPAAASRTLEAWHESPLAIQGVELPEPAAASLLSGETGILLAAWLLDPSDEWADELHRLVRANVANQTNELMWGSPGTMLTARAMHALTGEQRWASAWRESADELWARREADGLWTQRTFGHASRILGPAHGLVGNVLALLDGDLLDDERRGVLERETAAALRREAVVEDGLANWPPSAGGDLVHRTGQIRVQWCHGAPGIVTSAAGYLDPELLLAGAELTWRAGPHGDEKGAGICHGTAGNGYALLKAFERTGDELWLDRARRFAVHALEQVERGDGRYSLFTGDVGVALYAADCLDARAIFPIVDEL